MIKNTKGEWVTAVKRLLGRKNFNNYDMTVKIVHKLGYPEFYKNAAVVDGYPGIGVFSAGLYNTVPWTKYIMLEPFAGYNKFLQTLVEPDTNKLSVSREDPYRWGTFTELIDDGTLPVSKQPFSQIHDGLLYTANLTHPQGEQLAAQYLNCVSNRSWLQKYGRVRMLLWIRSSTAEKLLAGPGEPNRHRISVQRESCCDARVILHTPTPSAEKRGKDKTIELLREPMFEWDQRTEVSASSQVPMSLVELTPKEHQMEHLDEFEYVAKNIFLLKSTPLSQALASLGPGANDDLAVKLEDILHKKPTELTLDDFKRMTRAFYEWPFKPEFLFDFYEEGMLGLGNGIDDSRM